MKLTDRLICCGLVMVGIIPLTALLFVCPNASCESNPIFYLRGSQADCALSNTEDLMPKPTSTRHYIVRSKENGDAVALIDAASVAAARSHFVGRTYTVAYAEQKDVMEAIRAGIEPELAGTDGE